jgi:hypothetical protein
MRCSRILRRVRHRGPRACTRQQKAKAHTPSAASVAWLTDNYTFHTGSSVSDQHCNGESRQGTVPATCSQWLRVLKNQIKTS